MPPRRPGLAGLGRAAAAMLLGLTTVMAAACNPARHEATLIAPYDQRQVWAVVPVRNESGSIEPDSTLIADHLARQLEAADGLSVLAVNRVLGAMRATGLETLGSPADAQQLRRTLGADAIVVATLTAYDSYDPPAVGLALELFTGSDEPAHARHHLNVRDLVQASTDTLSRPEHAQPGADPGDLPASVVTGHWSGADPAVRRDMQRYARHRGVEQDDPASWRLYRISMDLFTEFVAFAAAERLLEAEAERLRVPGDTAGADEANPS
ncbi:MAG: hypothetical protein WD316_03735 [Phycisphaeraceae bacterium]